MGMKRNSGHFLGASGGGGPSKRIGKSPIEINSKKPIIDKKGHVTFNSISARREFFLGKSVARLEHELKKMDIKPLEELQLIEGQEQSL